MFDSICPTIRRQVIPMSTKDACELLFQAEKILPGMGILVYKTLMLSNEAWDALCKAGKYGFGTSIFDDVKMLAYFQLVKIMTPISQPTDYCDYTLTEEGIMLYTVVAAMDVSTLWSNSVIHANEVARALVYGPKKYLGSILEADNPAVNTGALDERDLGNTAGWTTLHSKVANGKNGEATDAAGLLDQIRNLLQSYSIDRPEKEIGAVLLLRYILQADAAEQMSFYDFNETMEHTLSDVREHFELVPEPYRTVCLDTLSRYNEKDFTQVRRAFRELARKTGNYTEAHKES